MGRYNRNRVDLGGNLTSDPELVDLGNDRFVTNASLALNESYVTNGERKERTTFVDITAWGNVAKRLAEFKKGDNLSVEGRLERETWEKDGETRHKLKVNVARFQYIGARKVDDNYAGEEEQAPAPAQAAKPAAKSGNPLRTPATV